MGKLKPLIEIRLELLLNNRCYWTMADIMSKEKRSKVMSRIRSKDTKPEILVRKYLHSQGLRFRVNKKDLPSKPDIVLAKYKTIILVHGCFWHHHDNGCRDGHLPKSNSDFWIKKIHRNIERDKQNLYALSLLGWKVIIVWECDLKKDKVHSTLTQLLSDIIGRPSIAHSIAS